MKSRHNLAKTNSDQDILDFIESLPDGVTPNQVTKYTGLSSRTALRRLQDLIKSNHIVRTGKGPSTRYKKIFSQAVPTQRSAVGYNPDFLEKYLPNKTFFLNAETRKELFQLGQRTGDTAQLETFIARIYERLLIDLSWSSSKLEGNTYSLLETEALLNNHMQAQGKDQIETQMILNHKDAVDFIIRNRQTIDLNPISIRNIHALLSSDLLADSNDGGRYRDTPIGIEGSCYIPINIPQYLRDEFELFTKKARAIKDPFEQSFFTLIFIPYLQPFIDINKRTSRILCNMPFITNSLSPLSFNEIERDTYVKAMIAIYETNDISDLVQLFTHAYRSSALRYQVAKNSLVAPNPLKIKYRDFIRQGISNLIKDLNYQTTVLSYDRVDFADRADLLKLIEKELKGLHEGNFARYDVLPSEFEEWHKKRPWKS